MTFSCEDVAPEDADCTYTNGDIGNEKMFKNTDWASFQVVFLAALVGMDSAAKTEILDSLRGRLAPGTLVVARSAEGLRGVLYPVCYFPCSFSSRCAPGTSGLEKEEEKARGRMLIIYL